ncbi:MAG: DUF2480 family protein [Bacteroidia bacterium]|nr:DUF2480 family protein [Bacteroidia bacterium]
MEIPVNRVAKAGLKTIDLEGILSPPPLKALDLAQFLEEGLLLREKTFRAALKDYNWAEFDGAAVAIYVSTEAIIPPWAYLLAGMYLAPHAVFYAVTTPTQLKEMYQLHALEKLDWQQFRDSKVLIKGCSSISPTVMTEFFRRLQPLAYSIFYGEACSSVPIYKRAR